MSQSNDSSSVAPAPGSEQSAAEMNAEANAFARALLMPEDWLVKDIQAMGGIDVDDDKAVAKLAKKYRVTTAQMILRIGEILCSPKALQ